VGSGQYKEKLSWEDTNEDSGTIEVRLAGATASSPVRAESLYYQATTRGGRPVEYLLAGKAKFKEAAKTTSDVSSAVAVGAVQVANMQAAAGQYNQALTSDYIAVGSAVFSMFSKIAENSTKPAADTRTWESIPGSIWLETAAATPAGGVSEVSVLVDGHAHRPDLTGATGSCTAVWFRASEVPAPHAAAAEKIDSTAEAKARLKTFQGKLPSMF
jgi:hypothetical protein